ncbi:molecular chaperone [Vibrio breoganii]|uniref:Chaperone protein skp n=1 Tax=Vibrio breoganii TaxID=553239 RepID=A0AAN0XVK8_9VIBR|nr:OmpH family outer membrane protein [Vibrio breoganii]ANO33473.1 molecular chaperone [Vibrio breoganii]MDN3716210.1 OmpH family outer membrane protein [Vibrio breoganii]OED85256.1 molecular chaperone [Vibrio breoganii ZF-55]OEF82598.1 molecular chaperone [Vibrio breoganii 1C10]PMG82690.1 molecular chaperone [Vibrio breoganii]
MKKLIKAAGLSLVVLSTSLVAHAAEAAQKVAYVNTAQIFQELPQREAVLRTLQDEFKDKSAELKEIEGKIKSKMDQARRDGELLGDDGVRKLQIEIAGLEAEYKLKGQALERDGKRREAQEKQKLFKVIQDAIGVVAEREGIDMVVDAQALQYAKPELDLSQKVIDELK